MGQFLGGRSISPEWPWNHTNLVTIDVPANYITQSGGTIKIQMEELVSKELRKYKTIQKKRWLMLTVQREALGTLRSKDIDLDYKL